jgi:hypothetical protein
MIEDMTVRNLSPATQQSYLNAVSKLSRYFGCSPDRLGLEDVHAFQVHLVATGISWPSLNQIVCAVRFDVPVRFRNSKAVGAVFGLTPSKYQSGEINRTGAISRCGDEMMRMMLYEAAQSMLTRTTKWSWLKAWAMKIARHRGMKKAIVALARRLAVIMHRIWVDGTEFRWSREVEPA